MKFRITLSVEFYQLAEFSSQIAGFVNTPNAFEIADIYLRQFDLTSRSQGLSNEVRFNVDNFVTVCIVNYFVFFST